MNATSVSSSQLLSPIPTVARHELEGLLRDASWPGEPASVVLAVHEALVNAHRHGGGVTSATAQLRDDQALVIEVYDRGPGFEALGGATSMPDPMAESGRGLWLMRRIADRCDVHRRRGENCVRLVFRP